jgi:hypothetical protein
MRPRRDQHEGGYVLAEAEHRRTKIIAATPTM